MISLMMRMLDLLSIRRRFILCRIIRYGLIYYLPNDSDGLIIMVSSGGPGSRRASISQGLV